MIYQRFKNRQGRHLVNIDGRFSLMHLGGGHFLYTLPGRSRPVVRKIDLGTERRGVRSVGFVAAAASVIGIALFFNYTTGATATAVNGSESLQNLSPEEMERRSDEIKERILMMDERGGSEGQVSFYTYRVKNGDTLTGISSQVGVQADHIAASSGIDQNALIKPGQLLTIPGQKGVLYEIKKGDSLAAVAQYYSVSLSNIRASNPDTMNLDLIDPGTKIFLPNAKVPIVNPQWILPVYDRLTSGFGYRRHPLYGYRQLHAGIDIRAKYIPVRASRDGTVLFAGNLGTYGNAVIIKHSGEFKTLYAHLSRIFVSPGMPVKAGRKIAISGSTGMSTGPHLHFEVIRNGRPVNPLKYVRR
jgi:murein DD-endopeptidase MepM/ murein hydrolase activator NlpD